MEDEAGMFVVILVHLCYELQRPPSRPACSYAGYSSYKELANQSAAFNRGVFNNFLNYISDKFSNFGPENINKIPYYSKIILKESNILKRQY